MLLVWTSNAIPPTTSETVCSNGPRQRLWQPRKSVCSLLSACRRVLMSLCRIGSYAWKAEWGPNYHQSMFIGLASLALSTVLGLSQYPLLDHYHCA